MKIEAETKDEKKRRSSWNRSVRKSFVDKWRGTLVREEKEWNDPSSEEEEDGLKLFSGEKLSKRENVIKELVETEHRHVVKLRILHHLFFKRIKAQDLISEEQMKRIFINHESVLKVHEGIYAIFKKARKKNWKRIVKALNQIFTGNLGNELESELSIYCSAHKDSYNYLKQLRAEKEEFGKLVDLLEREKDSKGEKLENILASCFQRITKYPLMIKELMKETEEGGEEHQLLKTSLNGIEKLLCVINEAVKKGEMKELLITLRGNMEQSTEIAVDILMHDNTLLHAGTLFWVLEKQKRAKVEVLLGSKYLFILSNGNNSKLLLKHHSCGESKGDRPLILPLQELIVRGVASNKCGFYVISSAVYEFIANSVEACKCWILAVEKAKEELRIKTIHSLIAETTTLISEMNSDILSQELIEKLKVLRETINGRTEIKQSQRWFWQKLYGRR